MKQMNLVTAFEKTIKRKHQCKVLRWEKLERALANLLSSGTAFGIRIQRGAAQHVHLLYPKVVVARAKAIRAYEAQTSSTGKKKGTSAA
ncbi:hypothetical protein ABE501_20715 [Comamonas testosteroni]